ncbi:MAG: hypothetical protein ACXACY_13020 [Candidatus Hodarchaeales archaeon]|jgi:hypothetical protein
MTKKEFIEELENEINHIKNQNRVSQQMFGVDYDSLGMSGKWAVEDKLKKSLNDEFIYYEDEEE